MSKQYTYFFNSQDKQKTKQKIDKNIYGGKGANLIEMSRMGIVVPPGFVISTTCCHDYLRTKELSVGLKKEIEEQIILLERVLNKKFGGSKNPLFISIRSGAPVSMPGMMDTILNLGLNKTTLTAFIEQTNNPRFVLDSYRRFMQTFGEVVRGIPLAEFDEIFISYKKKENIINDFDLSIASLEKVIADYKKLLQEKTGLEFPEDVRDQLYETIEAVFSSWNNERAIYFRNLNNISDDLGTAVVIQSMVFGNISSKDSGTGVAFTRNPATGTKEIYGEFLLNAQGEDVVAGIRTPQKIEELAKIMPQSYKQLLGIAQTLESSFNDIQDIEFTIQEGQLYLLQTRNAARTTKAAMQIAYDMVMEEKQTKQNAIQKINPNTIPALLSPVFSLESKKKAIELGKLLATGINAGPGVASGFIAFDTADVLKYVEEGKDSILVRKETSPEDIIGMEKTKGVLTAFGGMTSHAAVVARGMNKPCIVGCSELEIHKDYILITHKEKRALKLKRNDIISIDGSTGEVLLGSIDIEQSFVDKIFDATQVRPSANEKKTDVEKLLKSQFKDMPAVEKKLCNAFFMILDWVDDIRSMQVRANADTPKDAIIARKYGAEGIGLCRTEHMFFQEERICHMREMILAETEKERELILEKLLAYQIEDFIGIFEAMESLPVTIRLLDPPLHEFMPRTKEQIGILAKQMKYSKEKMRARIESLEEQNPMLGHRGCRLGITHPAITRMQTRAIISAAIHVHKQGMQVFPEIMVPLVGDVQEFILQKKIIQEVAEGLFKSENVTIDYKIGTMIEVPRAALNAHEIASHADFFSFGTNDLTQMTLGFSRDDSTKFLEEYKKLNIYKQNPFTTIDKKGVGKLIKMAIQDGREAKSKLKLGVCGEQGADAESIDFFYSHNVDYISCSPFRIPIARIAAAQAKINHS